MRICEVEANADGSVTDKSRCDRSMEHDAALGHENGYDDTTCVHGKVLVMLCPAHSHCVRPRYEDDTSLDPPTVERAKNHTRKKTHK